MELLPRQRGHDVPREAGNIVESFIGMTQMSGPAAVIEALARLPESIQQKQLENENEAERRAFELEKHRLELMAKDRDAERQSRREDRVADIAVDQRTETLTYVYVLVLTVLACAILAWLLYKEKYEYAAPVLSGLLGGGAGFLGGKSTGYSKARKEMKREKEDPPSPSA